MEQQLSRSKALWCVVLISVLLSFPWLDRAFYTRGEPREALVAQAMVDTGQWLLPPSYNGDVPAKPPFSHWLSAIVSLPFGDVSEATSRLPSAIAFVVFTAMFQLFLAARVSLATALLSSLLLLCSPEWFRAASTCRVDTILSMSFAGALLALFVWEERGRRGAPLVAIFLLTCAVLTKGPVGIVLPFIIFSVYCVTKYGWSRKALAKLALDELLISIPVITVVSLWYIAAYLQWGEEFIVKVRYENVERFTSSMHDEPHKHSVPYLFGALMVGFLPWSLAWALACVRGWNRTLLSVSGLKDRWSKASELVRFSLIAVLSIILFFCIPSSKRGIYLLPAYPFIAFLAASSVQAWLPKSERLLRWLYVTMSVLTALILLGIAFILLVPFSSDTIRFTGSLQETLAPFKIGIIICSVGALLWMLRGVKSVAGGTAISRLAASIITIVVVAYLLLVDPGEYQISPKAWLSSTQFLEAVRPTQRERFYSFGSEAYSASFYLRKPFYMADKTLPAGSVVFIEAKNLDKFKQEIGVPFTELSRYSSGLENPLKKDLVVVETGTLK